MPINSINVSPNFNGVEPYINDTNQLLTGQAIEVGGGEFPDWFRAFGDSCNSNEALFNRFITYSSANSAKFKLAKQMRERNIERVHLFNKVDRFGATYNQNDWSYLEIFHNVTSIINAYNITGSRSLIINIPIHKNYYDRIENGILYVKDYLNNDVLIRKDTATYYLCKKTGCLYFTSRKPLDRYIHSFLSSIPSDIRKLTIRYILSANRTLTISPSEIGVLKQRLGENNYLFSLYTANCRAGEYNLFVTSFDIDDYELIVNNGDNHFLKKFEALFINFLALYRPASSARLTSLTTSLVEHTPSLNKLNDEVQIFSETLDLWLSAGSREGMVSYHTPTRGDELYNLFLNSCSLVMKTKLTLSPTVDYDIGTNRNFYNLQKINIIHNVLPSNKFRLKLFLRKGDRFWNKHKKILYATNFSNNFSTIGGRPTTMGINTNSCLISDIDYSNNIINAAFAHNNTSYSRFASLITRSELSMWQGIAFSVDLFAGYTSGYSQTTQQSSLSGSILNSDSNNNNTTTNRTTYNNDGYLMPYSTNVLHHKVGKLSLNIDKEHTKSFLFMGIELEYNTKKVITDSYLSITTANLIRDIANSTIGNYCVMKSDASIGEYGFEIVTIPATLNYHKDILEKFFFSEEQGKDFYKRVTTPPSCGLHVHIDKSKLTPTQFGKIVVFINKQEHSSFIQKLGGRSFNGYCRPWEANLLNRKSKAGKDQSIACISPYLGLGIHALNNHKKTWKRNSLDNRANRRKTVNIASGPTLELRFFKSTNIKKILFRRLEFCDAIVRFCGAAGIQDITVIKFVEWLIKPENKKNYPHLVRWLFAMGYLTRTARVNKVSRKKYYSYSVVTS